jgi:hypothetical protein
VLLSRPSDSRSSSRLAKCILLSHRSHLSCEHSPTLQPNSHDANSSGTSWINCLRSVVLIRLHILAPKTARFSKVNKLSACPKRCFDSNQAAGLSLPSPAKGWTPVVLVLHGPELQKYRTQATFHKFCLTEAAFGRVYWNLSPRRMQRGRADRLHGARPSCRWHSTAGTNDLRLSPHHGLVRSRRRQDAVEATGGRSRVVGRMSHLGSCRPPSKQAMEIPLKRGRMLKIVHGFQWCGGAHRVRVSI